MRNLNWLLDLIFPKKCLGCGKFGNYLCPDCLNFASCCHKAICPVCTKPAFIGLTHVDCQKPNQLDGLISPFFYQGIIKKAILKLKFNFVTDLTDTIVNLYLSVLAENKLAQKILSQKELLFLAIPLFWQRKNWRGFNQAELLGQKISQKLALPFRSKLLFRIKQTTSQIDLSKSQRLNNIKGAFQTTLAAKDLSRKYHQVIIFDDVWTTGATMREAARVLKQSGFAKVWGFTLARQKLAE